MADKESTKKTSKMWLIFVAIVCITAGIKCEMLSPSNTDAKYFKNYYHPKTTTSLLGLTSSEVNNAISFSSSAIANLRRLEENILHSQRAENKELVSSIPDKKAMEIAKRAVILEKATLYLMARHCYKNFSFSSKCSKIIKQMSASDATSVNICNSQPKERKMSGVDDQYRTLDGSFNHRTAPSLGSALTNYKRLLRAEYLDDVQVPRRSIFRKFSLPSARAISQSMVTHDNNAAGQSSKVTIAFAYWAEFLAQDMVDTHRFKMVHFESSISCCSKDGGHLAPRYLHPKCDAIHVPATDAFYTKRHVQCLNYVRSTTGVPNNCSFGHIEQLNHATHYLDASHIYGTTKEYTARLRTGKEGQVNVLSLNGQHSLYDMNFNPLHIVFLREHNRLAKELVQQHPRWTDEKIFQETRRIVMAEIQHITYSEWLPLLFSRQNLNTVLNATTFQEAVDPSVTNSFATAAIRFAKSLFPASIKLVNEDRSIDKTLNLCDHLYRTQVNGEIDGFGALLRGLATQKSRKLDLSYAKDLVDFHEIGFPSLDVISLDVQRGRDHGLPGYNAFRKFCGLKEAREFDDFAETMPKEYIKALSSIYKHPNDVDLIIGGLAERRQDDGILGPTFSCIMSDQFQRSRVGDRYFFAFQMPQEQVQEIRRTSLAKLICDNGGDLERLQRHVFLLPDGSNPLVTCDEIDGINLRAWDKD